MTAHLHGRTLQRLRSALETMALTEKFQIGGWHSNVKVYPLFIRMYQGMQSATCTTSALAARGILNFVVQLCWRCVKIRRVSTIHWKCFIPVGRVYLSRVQVTKKEISPFSLQWICSNNSILICNTWQLMGWATADAKQELSFFFFIDLIIFIDRSKGLLTRRLSEQQHGLREPKQAMSWMCKPHATLVFRTNSSFRLWSPSSSAVRNACPSNCLAPGPSFLFTCWEVKIFCTTAPGYVE